MSLGYSPTDDEITEGVMAKTRGAGLLMVWVDIDAEHEAEVGRWYDDEQMPRVLEVPGILSGGRYAAVKGAPKQLVMYELDDHNVLHSAAYLTLRYAPSAGRERAAGRSTGRNFRRNAYRQIFPVHTDSVEQTRGPAPFLQIGRIDIGAAMEEEFNDWYNTAYIPPYLTVPGCLGARRFVAIDGQPKYLTVYEFEHAAVSESAVWAKVRDANPWSFRVRPAMRHDKGSPGVYRRLFPK